MVLGRGPALLIFLIRDLVTEDVLSRTHSSCLIIMPKAMIFFFFGFNGIFLALIIVK